MNQKYGLLGGNAVARLRHRQLHQLSVVIAEIRRRWCCAEAQPAAGSIPDYFAPSTIDWTARRIDVLKSVEATLAEQHVTRDEAQLAKVIELCADLIDFQRARDADPATTILPPIPPASSASFVHKCLNDPLISVVAEVFDDQNCAKNEGTLDGVEIVSKIYIMSTARGGAYLASSAMYNTPGVHHGLWLLLALLSPHVDPPASFLAKQFKNAEGALTPEHQLCRAATDFLSDPSLTTARRMVDVAMAHDFPHEMKMTCSLAAAHISPNWESADLFGGIIASLFIDAKHKFTDYEIDGLFSNSGPFFTSDMWPYLPVLGDVVFRMRQWWRGDVVTESAVDWLSRWATIDGPFKALILGDNPRRVTQTIEADVRKMVGCALPEIQDTIRSAGRVLQALLDKFVGVDTPLLPLLHRVPADKLHSLMNHLTGVNQSSRSTAPPFGRLVTSLMQEEREVRVPSVSLRARAGGYAQATVASTGGTTPGPVASLPPLSHTLPASPFSTEHDPDQSADNTSVVPTRTAAATPQWILRWRATPIDKEWSLEVRVFYAMVNDTAPPESGYNLRSLYALVRHTFLRCGTQRLAPNTRNPTWAVIVSEVTTARNTLVRLRLIQQHMDKRAEHGDKCVQAYVRLACDRPVRLEGDELARGEWPAYEGN